MQTKLPEVFFPKPHHKDPALLKLVDYLLRTGGLHVFSEEMTKQIAEHGNCIDGCTMSALINLADIVVTLSDETAETRYKLSTALADIFTQSTILCVTSWYVKAFSQHYITRNLIRGIQSRMYVPHLVTVLSSTPTTNLTPDQEDIIRKARTWKTP